MPKLGKPGREDRGKNWNASRIIKTEYPVCDKCGFNDVDYGPFYSHTEDLCDYLIYATQTAPAKGWKDVSNAIPDYIYKFTDWRQIVQTLDDCGIIYSAWNINGLVRGWSIFVSSNIYDAIQLFYSLPNFAELTLNDFITSMK